MSLPGVAPSTVEAAHLVGIGSCEQDACAFPQGQHVVFILQQHHALYGSLVGALGKLLTAELRIVFELLSRTVEKPEAVFHSQDTAHGVVDAAHGDGTLLGELFDEVDGIGVIGFHDHVDAGVDGHAQRVFLIFGHTLALPQIVDIGPVGDEHAVPACLRLEPVGEQRLVGVNGHAVDRC